MSDQEISIEVIQADRIKAAPYLGFAFRRAIEGQCDDNDLVQAFARHRLTADREGWMRGVGEAAAVARAYDSDRFDTGADAAEFIAMNVDVLDYTPPSHASGPIEVGASGDGDLATGCDDDQIWADVCAQNLRDAADLLAKRTHAGGEAKEVG